MANGANCMAAAYPAVNPPNLLLISVVIISLAESGAILAPLYKGTLPFVPKLRKLAGDTDARAAHFGSLLPFSPLISYLHPSCHANIRNMLFAALRKRLRARLQGSRYQQTSSTTG